MFQALRKEGTPCFMLESVENKDQWGRYSFIGINPKSEIKISGKELEVDGVKQEEEFKMSYLSDLIEKYKSPSYGRLSKINWRIDRIFWI